MESSLLESKGLPRFSFIAIVIAALLVSLASWGAYLVYDYTEHDPYFCSSCHVMQPAWDTWHEGPHESVNCHVCHQQNIQDRVRIVWRWAVDDVEEVPPHTRLARTVCEQCHLDQEDWPQIAESAGHKVHALRAGLECLSCHLPSLHAVEPKTEDCLKCHPQARSNMGSMDGFHCTNCHNFMASEEAELKPTRELCLECHAGMQLKGETFPEGAPMSFDCATCHKPHTQPFLHFNDCLGCHVQVAEDAAHFEAKALTRCVDCHRPHSWRAQEPAAGDGADGADGADGKGG